jgi:hypothetical protein
MEDEAGLGLAVQWIQQALVTAYEENCPLRPTKNGRKSLRWTPEIPEKYVSICSDSLAALKALRAVRTTSPLVHQCQRALNDIFVQHAVGLFWVPGHAGIRGNEIADGLARGSSALRFFRPEPANGEVLVTPKGRLASLSRVLVWLTQICVPGLLSGARGY